MESLYKAFEKDFYIGASVTPELIQTQGDFIAKQFKSITAENQMKFEALQPKRGQFEFEVADQMVDFARTHGMKMRGHTLVWHQQTPKWVFTKANGACVGREELLETMKTHITQVMTHFKQAVYCWDVLNEAICDGPGYLRPSQWLKGIGEDYIDKAFCYAREADEKALLFYNDYNAVTPEKRDKIYQMVKGLIERGVPIDGIGIQGHWNINWPSYEQVKVAIEQYASLGLKLQITELDLSLYDGEEGDLGFKVPPEERLEKQAQCYERFFKLFKAYKEVITGVTFWGVADDYTWLDYFPVRYRKNWPFVFDQQYQAKLAYEKLINLSKN